MVEVMVKVMVKTISGCVEGRGNAPCSRLSHGKDVKLLAGLRLVQGPGFGLSIHEVSHEKVSGLI